MSPTEKQSLIVSAETAGLGNRIKSWVSAMRLGPEVRVHWAVNDNMPASFAQLFAGAHCVESIPPDALVYKSWRLLVLPEDEPHLPAGFATVGAGAHPLVRGLGKVWWNLLGQPTDRYRYMIFPKSHSRRSTRADARHIDLEYERIPEYFRGVYGQLFRQIEIRSEIRQQVDEWANANLNDDVIGVQVRTWRDDPRRQRKYYRPAVKRLARLMSSAAPSDRFLVVSDSDEVVDAMRRQYGGHRVVDFPRQTARLHSWRSADGITEDLIDMLLLARTRRLFASYLSTFSEAAWWLGGAKAHVAVF
jgi:hypothetical protein